MFSESGNLMAILVINELETGSQILKMAAANRMYLNLSFYAR
jgi:hypothetical protein